MVALNRWLGEGEGDGDCEGGAGGFAVVVGVVGVGDVTVVGFDD